MKNFIFIFIMLFLSTFKLMGQITFDKRYNKEISLNGGKKLFELTDRYIITGSWGDFSQTDTLHPMFLVIDKKGNVIADNTINNNTCHFHIEGNTKTNQNDFIGVGGTNTPGDTCGLAPIPYPTRSRFYLHKVDKNGQIIWQKNYGDTLYDNNYIAGFNVTKSSDGNYLVLGVRNNNTCIIKINEQGDTLWTRTIPGQYDLNHYSIKKVKNGFLCFIGYPPNNYIIKIDNDANLIWKKTVPFNFGKIAKTNDNGFVISLPSKHPPDYPSTQLIKINQEAEVVWQHTYDSLNAGGAGVHETMDNNYVLAYQDLAKVDSLGNIIWRKRLIQDNFFFFYNDIIETSDGGLLITGRTKDFQVILTKTDCRGNLDWDSSACPIITDNNLKIYPNPFKDEITIVLPKNSYKGQTAISLYNIQGQKVKQLIFNNQQVLKINTTNLASGLYLYKINLDEKIIKTGKILRE